MYLALEQKNRYSKIFAGLSERRNVGGVFMLPANLQILSCELQSKLHCSSKYSCLISSQSRLQ